MTEDLHGKIFLAALHEIPFSGFSAATLAKAGEQVGATATVIRALFPDGGVSLVKAFSYWADARIQERVGLEAPERMRDRVAFCVRARIEALAPHKEAARRAAAFLALPQNGPLAAKLLFRSVDVMWRTAGDRTSDFNYYTKRALLAAVYGSTLVYWFSDSSDGNADTWSFLDARIDDVMRIQSLRGDVERVVSKLPDPVGVLAALRASSRR